MRITLNLVVNILQIPLSQKTSKQISSTILRIHSQNFQQKNENQNFEAELNLPAPSIPLFQPCNGWLSIIPIFLQGLRQPLNLSLFSTLSSKLLSDSLHQLFENKEVLYGKTIFTGSRFSVLPTFYVSIMQHLWISLLISYYVKLFFLNVFLKYCIDY